MHFRLLPAVLYAAACSETPSIRDSDGGLDASTDGGNEATWVVLTSTLDRAVLSAYGFGGEDVWFSGGGFELAGGLTLHYDGKSFTDVPNDTNETLWWVWGCAPNDIWFVGTNGVALRWDGSVFTPYTTGTTATLFGVWGSSCDDVWAVGGSPQGGENDVMLRFNGKEWLRQAKLTLCTDEKGKPRTCGKPYFKVWGSAADDVFVVGTSGLIIHYDGKTWSQMESGAGAVLFTVWGTAFDDVYAVGGQSGPPVVLHYDGRLWNTVSGDWINCGPIVNGVSADANGDAWVVGTSGIKFRLREGTWFDDCLQEPRDDLHAVWSDGQGGAFAVGGNFLTACSGGACEGVIAHFGIDHPIPLP